MDAWAPKVVQAAAGAHFLVPVVGGVGHLGRQVVWANLLHEEQEDRNNKLDELDSVCREERQNQELCTRFREMPVKTNKYSEFEFDPGFECREINSLQLWGQEVRAGVT